MDWTACVAPEPAKPGKAQVAIGRFGHSATLVDARDVWGTELVVVFGGVVPATDNEQPDQHAAVSDVAVLQAEPPARWFAPALAPEGTWWVPMCTHACMFIHGLCSMHLHGAGFTPHRTLLHQLANGVNQGKSAAWKA